MATLNVRADVKETCLFLLDLAETHKADSLERGVCGRAVEHLLRELDGKATTYWDHFQAGISTRRFDPHYEEVYKYAQHLHA